MNTCGMRRGIMRFMDRLRRDVLRFRRGSSIAVQNIVFRQPLRLLLLFGWIIMM